MGLIWLMDQNLPFGSIGGVTILRKGQSDYISDGKEGTFILHFNDHYLL